MSVGLRRLRLHDVFDNYVLFFISCDIALKFRKCLLNKRYMYYMSATFDDKAFIMYIYLRFKQSLRFSCTAIVYLL